MRNKNPDKRRFVICLVAFLMALGVSIFVGVKYISFRIRLTFAKEQVQIFEQMKTDARRGNIKDAAGCLDYTVNYYPSGSKQTSGTKLDWLVENSRKNAIREIIDSLREKTGKDLGDTPEPWIEQFAEK